MATVGKIPDRKDVTLIGSVYDSAAKKLTKIFKSVYPIDEFLILETPRLMKEVRGVVNQLNRFAISWSRRSVTRAYGEAQAVSETKLRALKEKPDPAFDESIHKITKDIMSEATTEDLVKANQSILVTANTFFEIIGKTKEGLLQIQAFDFQNEEVIAGLLDDAIREGESRDQIAKRIREYIQTIIGDEQYIQINGRNYNMKKYSKMVARTRLRKVQSESTRNSCAQFDHDIVEISDHGTETEICLEFEGNIYSLSGATKGYPVLTQDPPFHPNCVLGNTRLKSPGGIVSGYRVRFSGPIIEFMFADKSRLSVTPNHMLLTPNGFASAYLLCEGDDIFYCPDFERIVTGDPNDNGKPARIDDIIETLSKSSGMTTCRMPIAAEYFHNDGRFCDGDVDVIRSNRLLINTREPEFFQPLTTDQFDSSGVALSQFFSLGSLAQILHSAAHASDGVVGSLRASAPFFLCRPRSGDLAAFTNASEGISNFNQPHSSCVPRNPKMLTNLAEKHSRFIQLQKIVGIDINSFHGFVYDIQTYTSLYLANGIISSNCQHNMFPTSEEAIQARGEFERGELS